MTPPQATSASSTPGPSPQSPSAATFSWTHPQRVRLAILLVLGGIGVLGSYVLGIQGHSGSVDDVWGGVPEALKPLYTISMLTAATGFFPFTTLIFFRLDPDRVRIGSFGYGLFFWLYALVLVPSALWMPLTFEMIQNPSAGLWLAIRAVLFAVGIGSLGLIAALATVQPNPARGGWGQWLAIAGILAFSFQTAVLDALVWPAYFPTP